MRMCSLILLPAPCVPCRAGSSSVSRADPTQIDHIVYHGKIKLEVTCPNVPGCKVQQFGGCFMSTQETPAAWLEHPGTERDKGQLFHSSKGTLSLSQSQTRSCKSWWDFSLVPLRQGLCLPSIPYNIPA